MQRQPVSSSDLSSVGYDATTQTLEIQFKSGSVYQYYGVPSGIFNGLLSASSHGTYFDRFIKHTYRYNQVN